MNSSDSDSILDYLRKFPGYPFDPVIDPDFIDELYSDFPGIDLLEQIKAFRWHHAGNLSSRFKSLRPALRRWLTTARSNAPF